MKIETRYSNGDTVYGTQHEYHTDKWQVIGPMTIGQVRVEITNSPGVEGEELFNNYMAQMGVEEQYMCVETGIGSGTLYHVDRLFDSKSAAETEANASNAMSHNDVGTGHQK